MKRIYKIIEGIFNLNPDKGDSTGKLGEHNFNEKKVSKIDSYTKDATISSTEASIYANQLYEAMDGAGTDEKQILYTLVKIDTFANFAMVYKEFKIKEYLLIGMSFFGSEYDLIDWLEEELDSSNDASYEEKQIFGILEHWEAYRLQS